MNLFSREVLIGIVVGFALAYLYNRFAVGMGAPAFPIVTGQNAQGSGVDRTGTPYNYSNPGR